MALSGSIWPCRALSAPIWPFLALSGPNKPFLPLSSPIWPCQVTLGRRNRAYAVREEGV